MRSDPVRIQAVRVGVVHGAADDVAEQLLAQRFQEIVLRLEVRVKGCASDVGDVDDLLNSDLVVALLCCKFAESGEDRRPCLFCRLSMKVPPLCISLWLDRAVHMSTRLT